MLRLLERIRMSRLRSQGVGVRDFFAISVYRHSLRFSSTSSATPAKPHFLACYLVNSLGFSEEDAFNASQRVSRITPSKNPDSVINFFKQSGLEDSHVRNIVSSVPKLLFFNVEKTLKPKLEFLKELGLSGSDLTNVLVRNKHFFARGLHTHVIPSIDYLKELLGSNALVVKVMKRSEWWLRCNVPKVVPPNVLLLEKYGFSKKKINKFIVHNPRYVMQKPEWLEGILHRVENELGIPQDSSMFSYGVDLLTSISKSTLEMKLGVFRSFGWSDLDILTVTRNLPNTLNISEVKLRKGLNFYMKELGYSSEYLASHTKVLMYSLEKRVLPRMLVINVLKEKKIIKTNRCLFTLLNVPELKFLDDYVFSYNDEVPSLHDTYVKGMA